MIIRTKNQRETLVININGKNVEVTAATVDDVFAVCRNPNRYEEVWFLSGDDGDWWLTCSYHKDWLPSIIAALSGEK